MTTRGSAGLARSSAGAVLVTAVDYRAISRLEQNGRRMNTTRPNLLRVARWLAPLGISAAVSLEVARPFAAGPVAFDSAASVLHFDRIVAGRHLELFLSTTPKPLLTFLYGPLFSLTHDWRFLTWSAIAALAIAVMLLAGLARRLDGDRAFAFVAIALAGAPTLLFDASLALASPWGLLLWAIAAWAVVVDRPRYWIAGLALGLAALARLETLVVVGVVLLILVALRFGPARVRRPVPRAAWLVGLGLLALPVAMLHDWLLTGNPLFWTTVAQRYSELTSLPVLTPGGLAVTLGRRYLAEFALVVLAVLGWFRLAGQGRWSIALGLLGFGPGIGLFLLLLAARGLFVSDRYFAAIDESIAFSAAFGLSALSVQVPALLRRLLERRGRSPIWLAPAVAAIVAVGLTAGWAGLGTDLRATIRPFLSQAEDARLVRPALLAAVDAAPSARAWPSPGQPGPARPLLLVPTPLRPEIAVDLNLPLTQVGSTSPASVDVAAGNPAPGQVMFHDRNAEASSPGLTQLETGQRTTIGSSVVVPLAVNAVRGYWVVRIDPAG